MRLRAGLEWAPFDARDRHGHGPLRHSLWLHLHCHSQGHSGLYDAHKADITLHQFCVWLLELPMMLRLKHVVISANW